MHSYIQHLAEIFARELGENVCEYTFVFPNQRAGLFFRKALGKQFDRPIFAPQILTINDCFYRLSDLQVDDELDLILRAYDIYRAQMPKIRPNADVKSLADFLFWGKMMVGDFSEIDNHLVANVKELFTTIRDLKQVDLDFSYLSDEQRRAISDFWGEFYQGNKNSTEISQNFVYIWSVLYPIYSELRSSLLRDGLAYDGLIHREVIEHWDEIEENRFCKHYVFIGFNALTASEEQLLLRLQDKGIADFYFDYTIPYLRDPQNRASLFMERNKRLFHSQYTITENVADKMQQPEITNVNISSTIGEAHETHAILHRILSELKPEDLTRTAIVLPDEKMLLPIISTIPEEIQKVNVTMGYPLSVTPTYALLDLLNNLYARATSAGFYHKDVEALLTHRYVRKEATEACIKLEQQILKEQLIYVPKDIFVGTGELIETIFSTTDVFVYLQRLLRLLPDTESEEVVTVITALNRIEQILLQHHIQGDAATVFHIVNMMIGDKSIAYAGEPLEGLQIMGVLETRALDFDNVIIASFNDDIYPGNARGNSFVPYTLRKGFGLPTPERQDAIFAYNFYRMIGYAQRVWLLTDSRSDDLRSGEPSRFLYQLKFQYQIPVLEETASYELHCDKQAERVIEKTPAVLQRLKNYAAGTGKKGFNPSSLNDYLLCPVLFYWKHLMNVGETEELQDDFSERDLGNAVHHTMELYYGSKKGVLQTSFEDRSAIHTLLEQQFKPDMSPLLLKVAHDILDIILNIDENAFPFTIIDVEHPCDRELYLTDGTKVRIKGKIDRIDKKDSTIRLIDYKTGSAKPNFEDIESLFDSGNTKRNHYAFQTLLYCFLYGEPHTEAHIYAVRNGAHSSTMVTDDTADFSYETIQDDFVNHLRELIEKIMNPTQPFVRRWDDRTCANCAFSQLCSVG